jgi:hypothetical protein
VVKSPGNFNISDDIIDSITSVAGLTSHRGNHIPNIRYINDEENEHHSDDDGSDSDDDDFERDALAAQNAQIQNSIDDLLDRQLESKE